MNSESWKVNQKIDLWDSSCRLESTLRPFMKTGIDYSGLLLVNVERSHKKDMGQYALAFCTSKWHEMYQQKDFIVCLDVDEDFLQIYLLTMRATSDKLEGNKKCS